MENPLFSVSLNKKFPAESLRQKNSFPALLPSQKFPEAPSGFLARYTCLFIIQRPTNSRTIFRENTLCCGAGRTTEIYPVSRKSKKHQALQIHANAVFYEDIRLSCIPFQAFNCIRHPKSGNKIPDSNSVHIREYFFSWPIKKHPGIPGCFSIHK